MPRDTQQSAKDPFDGILLPEDGVRVGPPLATRREFAMAAAATAAAAAMGTASRAFGDETPDTEEAADADEASDVIENVSGELSYTGESTVIDDGSGITTIDAEGNVHILNTYTDRIDEVTFEPDASFTLPVGCNVYVDCDSRAAVIQASSTSRPFTMIGCLDFETGEYNVVLSEAISGVTYAPSEARCTDSLMAWVEVDNATDAWAFYACPFLGREITAETSGLVKLAEGDAEWSAPQFAVSDYTVIWQAMPDTSGSHTTEYSHAYRWTLGAEEPTEIWESPGRFACEPNISAGILTIAPRVREDEGVYYGITALDMEHGFAQIDQLVLPVSVRPFFITRVGDNFVFSIEANYGYGGLMGTMGYYIGPGGGPFSYVAREPYAQVSYVGGYYIVKSTVSYFVIDMQAQTYARISSVSGCVDYGDYPATAGVASRFVTYAAVKDSSTGIPNGVVVRIFSLL